MAKQLSLSQKKKDLQDICLVELFLDLDGH